MIMLLRHSVSFPSNTCDTTHTKRDIIGGDNIACISLYAEQRMQHY